MKRLHLALAADGPYNEIGFNYDNINDSNENSQEDKIEEQITENKNPEDVFKLPSGLTPPEHIQLASQIIIKFHFDLFYFIKFSLQVLKCITSLKRQQVLSVNKEHKWKYY